MPPRRHEAGTVSAELALAIPAVLLVLALCIAGIGTAADQVRSAEAARAAARAAARGEDSARVAAIAREIAPADSVVTVSVVGDRVTVEVQAPRRAMLPGISGAQARAVAPLEPAVRGP